MLQICVLIGNEVVVHKLQQELLKILVLLLVMASICYSQQIIVHTTCVFSHAGIHNSVTQLEREVRFNFYTEAEHLLTHQWLPGIYPDLWKIKEKVVLYTHLKNHLVFVCIQQPLPLCMQELQKFIPSRGLGQTHTSLRVLNSVPLAYSLRVLSSLSLQSLPVLPLHEVRKKKECAERKKKMHLCPKLQNMRKGHQFMRKVSRTEQVLHVLLIPLHVIAEYTRHWGFQYLLSCCLEI